MFHLYIQKIVYVNVLFFWAKGKCFNLLIFFLCILLFMHTDSWLLGNELINSITYNSSYTLCVFPLPGAPQPREKFEELFEDLWEKSVISVKELLRYSHL